MLLFSDILPRKLSYRAFKMLRYYHRLRFLLTRNRNNLFLLIPNIFIPIGVVLFIVGFFRGRPPITGSTLLGSYTHGQDQLAPAPFDKIVFMMVDALRRYELTISHKKEANALT